MFESLRVTDSFKNSIKSAIGQSRLSHALIFEGADENTRLDAAKETAKAIVCTGENKPCKCCGACMKAEKDCHPDIHILYKEEGSSMIKVDAVRDIRSQALVFPNEGVKSVFIIHEAQDMNIQAQNALLKIFEEPSSHVCFILTCDSKASLLETVISRATVYSLGTETNKSETPDDVSAIEKAGELIRSLIKESEFEFIRKTAPFIKDKEFFRLTVEKMLSVSWDALILQSGAKGLISDESEEATMLKNSFTQRKTIMIIESLNLMLDDINSSANHNLAVTKLSSVLYNIKVN